jgi:5-methylcytosine-specific restriction endonuclease McrA
VVKPLRPCLECGARTHGTRCPEHERAYQRARNQKPGRRAYQDRAYKRIPARGICALCGLPGADTRDHIIPLSKGGTNHPTNIQLAHRACNSRKAAS